MRRSLLVPAALLAVSCAAGSRGPQPTGPAPTAAAPVVIPGMEPQPGETVTEYDLNRDGKADVRKYARIEADGRETVLRKEKDLNADGRVDTWEASAPDGTLGKLVHDLDFDGKPDVTLSFEKDQLVKKEYALGFDGVARSWAFYEKSKLVRKERDTNGDGKVDYWEYWDGGEVDRIGIDQDADGQVDRWESRTATGADAAQK